MRGSVNRASLSIVRRQRIVFSAVVQGKVWRVSEKVSDPVEDQSRLRAFEIGTIYGIANFSALQLLGCVFLQPPVQDVYGNYPYAICGKIQIIQIRSRSKGAESKALN